MPIDDALPLDELFGFTAKDLAANRQGMMTDHQRTLLQPPSGWRYIVNFLADIASVIVLFALCPIVLFLGFLPRLLENAVLLIIFASFLMGLVAFAIYLGRDYWRFNTVATALQADDAKKGIVHQATTQLLYDEVGEHLYAVDIQTGIWLYSDLLDGLDTTRKYRIYYAPQSEIILSLEALSMPPSVPIDHLITLSDGGRNPLPEKWQRITSR